MALNHIVYLRYLFACYRKIRNKNDNNYHCMQNNDILQKENFTHHEFVERGDLLMLI
jgi:hypothetical protein